MLPLLGTHCPPAAPEPELATWIGRAHGRHRAGEQRVLLRHLGLEPYHWALPGDVGGGKGGGGQAKTQPRVKGAPLQSRRNDRQGTRVTAACCVCMCMHIAAARDIRVTVSGKLVSDMCVRRRTCAARPCPAPTAPRCPVACGEGPGPGAVAGARGDTRSALLKDSRKSCLAPGMWELPV